MLESVWHKREMQVHVALLLHENLALLVGKEVMPLIAMTAVGSRVEIFIMYRLTLRNSKKCVSLLVFALSSGAGH